MAQDNGATPDQVKRRVYEAYARAIQSNMFVSRSGSGIAYLLRDTKLYGYEAGTDFAETHLDLIVQEAVADAGSRKPSLSIPVHGFGRSAVEGMAWKLGELTALHVERNASVITLTWADTTPRMV